MNPFLSAEGPRAGAAEAHNKCRRPGGRPEPLCAGCPTQAPFSLCGSFRADCKNSATYPSSSRHSTHQSHIVGRQNEAHGFHRLLKDSLGRLIRIRVRLQPHRMRRKINRALAPVLFVTTEWATSATSSAVGKLALKILSPFRDDITKPSDFFRQKAKSERRTANGRSVPKRESSHFFPHFSLDTRNPASAR
jgi:hypothetical protein